jgi:hypothetical protein
MPSARTGADVRTVEILQLAALAAFVVLLPPALAMRRLLQWLTRLEAFDEATAQRPGSRPLAAHAARRLAREGVLREAGDGRVFLDGAQLLRWRRRRRQRAAVAVVAALAATGLVLRFGR